MIVVDFKKERKNLELIKSGRKMEEKTRVWSLGQLVYIINMEWNDQAQNNCK